MPASDLRPTTDKVRQALFNILGPLEGRSFLDLYAGSGSVGLEAWSRGAGRVVSVERDQRFCSVIVQNAALIHADMEVRTASVPALLEHALELPFDVVFLDPPYHSQDDRSRVVLLDWGRIVSADGVIVYEASSREDAPLFPAFELHKSRKYGETALHFFQRVKTVDS